MRREEVAESLSVLGLSRHESLVYSALLDFDRARAADLVRPSGIDRSHVYVALKRLYKKGLITISRNRVATFSAVPPKEALKRLHEQVESRLRKSREVVQTLSLRYAARRPLRPRREAIEVLGPADRASRLDIIRHWTHAKQEVLSFYGPQLHPLRRDAKAMARVDRREASVLRRGIPVRCVYWRKILEDEFERTRLKRNVAAGEKARVADEVPFNALVSDDDMAVFSLPDPEYGYVLYRVNDPRLIHIFRLAFEQLWAKAGPVDPYLK